MADPPHYADWGSRAGAALLDGAIVVALAIAAAAVSRGDGVWLVLAFLLASAYYVLTMSRRGARNGQTLGKQAVGIRVVRTNGQPVTPGVAIVREALGKLLVGNATLGLVGLVDVLWPLGDSENRALHDFPVRTRVVKLGAAAATPTPPSGRALAPPIARQLAEARRIEASITETVRRAKLPHADVSREVGALVGSLEQSAERAQLLWDALADTPVARVEQRLAEVSDPHLADALREQLSAQRRMQDRLYQYGSDLERIVVELDTVRANLVSAATSGGSYDQLRMAEAVRGLRDETGAIAAGMDAAYGDER